jgi:hypothetical protein
MESIWTKEGESGKEAGEDFIMRSFMTCMFYEIL